MKLLLSLILILSVYTLKSQSCNYIEYGDFENAKFEDDYTNSPNNGTPNDSNWRSHTLDTFEINTVDLYRVAANNRVTYIRDTTTNPGLLTFGICVFNNVLLNRPPFGGKIFAGISSLKNFGGPSFPDNRESISLKLKYPLRIGDSFRFSFHARKNQPVCSNFWVYIYGSKDRPCKIPLVTRLDGTISACGFKATLIDSIFVDTAGWKHYSFKFNATDSFKYFVTRMQDYFATNNDPNIRYGFFDDFELEKLGVKYKLKVSTNVDTFHVCRHQMSNKWDSIKFTVRLDTNTSRNLIPINAEIHIPAAYDNVDTPINGSPYNVKNLVIPPNTISKTDSIVFTIFPLNNTNANIHGQYADIKFVSSGQDYCLKDEVKVATKVFKGDKNMTVKIHEFPANICSDTITYKAIPVGGNAPYTYRWTRHESLRSSSTTYQITEKYMRSGIAIRIIDSNYCRVTVYRKSDSFGGFARINIPSLTSVYSDLDSFNEYRILDIFGPFRLDKNVVFQNCHFRMRGDYHIRDYINVENSAKFYNCALTSCIESTWKGIQLGTQGSSKIPELIMTDCHVEDAQTAISVLKNTFASKFNIGIARNKFFNNYNGIRLEPGHISIKNIDAVNIIPFQGNTFDLTRTLLKEFDIINPNVVSKSPNTLIYLRDVNYFSLGTHGKGRNDFYRSRIGIEAIRSNLDLKNFTITLMASDNSYPDPEGKAIEASMGVRTKFFQPPGKTVNIQAKANANHSSGPSIYMSDYGVLSNNIVLNLSNTSFLFHRQNPIHASSAWSLSPITIYDNHIEDFNGQAEAMYIRSYFKADIARDTVISSPDFNLNSIFLHAYNLNNNDSVLVRKNLVKNYGFPQMYPRRSSFMLQALGHTKKLNIFQNRFEMQGSDEEWDGAIGLINSNNIHAYQNQILGQGATKVNASESGFGLGAIQNPLGIYASGSTSVLSCNQVFDFNTSIRYSGTNLSSTMSVNTLTDHGHGLMVDNGASINPQLHQGNQWTGSLAWGAFNGNPALVIPRQLFTVHTSNAFTGNLLWPSENTSGIWFLPDNLSNDKTQCDLPPLPANNAPIKGKLSVSNFNGIATLWEGEIMLGGNLFTNYNNSLVFQNQLQLFGVMQDRSAMILANSPESNWLAANQNTAVGQFHRLERAIDTVLTPSPVHVLQLEHYLGQRAEAMQAISSLDSLKGLDSLGTNLMVYLSLEDYHRGQIRQIDNTIELLEQPRIEAIYSQLDQLIEQADEIETNALYLDYLKQMYSLNLRYLRNGELDSPSWDTIRQIADLCPLVSEKAVYMARSMMMGDTSIYYRDNLKCQGYGQKQTGTRREKPDILLYPNPANNKVTMRFPELYIEPLDIVVYNVMGREVWRETIKLSQRSHEINTSKFQKGLYIVRVLNGAEELSNIKLHVIH
jgi:hypothetical protein